MSKEKEDLIEIIVKPSYKKFYAEATNYGIYSAEIPEDSPNTDLIDFDVYKREINLVGSMPLLNVGSPYIAHVREIEHPKFGLQYEVKTIYEKPFSTRSEQVMFLNVLLTSSQVETITNAYPTENLIDIIKNDEIDVSLLKGIGDKIILKIKDKIIENEKYQVAIIELTGKFDIPYNAVKRLSELYGSPELLLQKINENPYLLTEVDGFGFKRVDEIALSMGVDKKSRQRIESCIAYLIKEYSENEGHVWVKSRKIISDAIKLLGVKIVDVQQVIDEIINADGSEIYQIEEKIFNKKNFLYELGIAINIQRLLESKQEVSLDFDFDKAVEEVEQEQGFKFTKEQREAILYGIRYGVIVTVGKAGTGKTSVIKGVIGVLKKYDAFLKSDVPMEYATCALSGKASQRIQESTGLDAFTIHRLLGFNPNTGWMYNENNRLGHDIIVLDEGSMVNSQLFYYLIRAIKDGGKLIVTGDIAQLEPIGVGNVLVDILKSPNVPSVELTIVHRQAQKSGILSNANLVRDGISFVDKNDYKNKRLGELEDLYLYPYKEKEKVLDMTLKIARKYNQDIMDFQILVPMKSRGELSTQSLNKELQLIFNKDPEDVDETKKIVRKYSTLLEGDKVIINGNDYDKNVFNGTMGIVEYIDTSTKDGEVIIDFEGVGRVSFKKDGLSRVDLGYAITIHKSQGSQWKYVLLAFDYSSYVLLNRQLVYTGMTRASLGLFFAVELKALQFAIETDKSSERNTFLSDMLNKVEKYQKIITPNE